MLTDCYNLPHTIQPINNTSEEYKFKVVRPSTEESGDMIDPHSDFMQQSFEMAEEAAPRPPIKQHQQVTGILARLAIAVTYCKNN